MTNEELKLIRQSKKMTQQQFGEWLGYAPRNAGRRVREMESGERAIPPKFILFFMREQNKSK